MKRQRKQYSADLKAKIAVEAVKGQRTIQEIGSHYSIQPSQMTQWKKQLLEGAAEVFSNGRVHAAEADEQMKAELYQQVGKLQMELLCRDRHSNSNAGFRIMPGGSRTARGGLACSFPHLGIIRGF